ncbi:hypothetical protein ABFS83_12G104800 [Erythranthe nasuta]
MGFFHSNFMLQIPQQEDDHHTTQFHGVGSSLLGKRPLDEDYTNNNNIINHCGDDELSDDGSNIGEKKRRLNIEQVRALEKSFESCNKLEPERKIQLARALGLQPRQIAIWFQNRRARWKTKQLEKDYDLLKRQFDAVKLDNDALHTLNQKLHAEIMALKKREPTESINLNKETEGSSSNNRSENSSEMKIVALSDNINYYSSRNDASIDGPLTAAVIRPLFPSRITDNIQTTVKEESRSSSLCNLFCSMDDQTGFWPWLDQSNFN